MQHIRAKYGDYFGITVAGYPGFLLLLSLFLTSLSLSAECFSAPFSTIIFSYSPFSFSSEAHPDVIESDGLATPEGYRNDLAYLKSKVLSSN